MRTTGCILFSCAVTTFAGSLPFSYGDVVNAPDAYVLEHTEVEIGVGASAFSFEDSLGVSDSDIKLTGYVNFGILSYGQIGVSYLADGGLVFNAKVAILKEGITVPAFSLGVQNGFGSEKVDCFSGTPGTPDSSGHIRGSWDEDGFYNYDHAQNWSVYGVASKNMRYLIGIPATVNFGIGIGRFVGVVDAGALGIGSSIANGLFGSVVWDPGENFSVGLEMDGRDLNMGVTYTVGKHVDLHLAWAEIEQMIFPPENQDKRDIMQNSKITVAVSSRFGPLLGAGRLELEREQQRIERARTRLDELEARRRSAESELQRLRDLLDERRKVQRWVFHISFFQFSLLCVPFVCLYRLRHLMPEKAQAALFSGLKRSFPVCRIRSCARKKGLPGWKLSSHSFAGSVPFYPAHSPRSNLERNFTPAVLSSGHGTLLFLWLITFPDLNTTMRHFFASN